MVSPQIYFDWIKVLFSGIRAFKTPFPVFASWSLTTFHAENSWRHLRLVISPYVLLLRRRGVRKENLKSLINSTTYIVRLRP